MNREKLLETRQRLDKFIEPLLPLFGRSERRHWADFYVQALMINGRRKNLAGMAREYGGDKQALQQFVTDSPWDPKPVKRELALRMVDVTGDSHACWIIDDTGFAKKGEHSVAVARQYSGTLGTTGNCQIALSLNYATDDGAFPVDFQLYLPQSWADDKERRNKAGVPAEVVFKPRWRIALDMLAQALDWGLPKTLVTADAAYGEVSDFRLGLGKLGLEYVVGIRKDIGVWTESVEMSRPIKREEIPPSRSVLDVAKSLPEESWQRIKWREGTKGPMTGRFAALRVQPSRGYKTWGIPEPMQWLLIEWPDGEPEPTKLWLCNLPEEVSLNELVYWAKMRWHVEQNYQQLKDELGMDHFEGRSWMGWYHHVTLSMIAFDFLLCEKLEGKKRWLDSAAGETGNPAHAYRAPGILPRLPQAHAYR